MDRQCNADITIDGAGYSYISVGKNNTVGTQSDISSESGCFLCSMCQSIYPTVVTADDIFQYGESVTLSQVLEPVYNVSSIP